MNQCDQSLNSNNFQKDQIESFYEEIDKSKFLPIYIFNNNCII